MKKENVILEQVKDILNKKNASLVVAYKDGSIKEYYNNRIDDLKAILKADKDALNKSIIADKVVGKVAASIMAVAGVKEIYAITLSELAIPVLESFNVKYSYTNLVTHIQNNAKTGMCPMEEKYQNEMNIEKIYNDLVK